MQLSYKQLGKTKIVFLVCVLITLYYLLLSATKPQRQAKPKLPTQPQLPVLGHFEICSGHLVHRDAITIVFVDGMDFNLSTSVVLDSLQRNYQDTKKADILLWNSFDPSEISLFSESFKSFQNDHPDFTLRWCNISMISNTFKKIYPNSNFHDSSLIHLSKSSHRILPNEIYEEYQTTLKNWAVLDSMGYEWALKLNTRFEFASYVPYNLFDSLRSEKKLYGYRSAVGGQDCGLNDKKYVQWLSKLYGKGNEDFQAIQKRHSLHCPSAFFSVSKVKWWLSSQVMRAIEEFHSSLNNLFQQKLLKMYGESLIFMSFPQLFLAENEIKHFVEFTYRQTLLYPSKVKGVLTDWIESGTEDKFWQLRFEKYFESTRSYHSLQMRAMALPCYHPPSTCSNIVAPCNTFLLTIYQNLKDPGPLIGCQNHTDFMATAFPVSNKPILPKQDLLTEKRILILGMSVSTEIPNFTQSLTNLLRLAPNTKTFIGISQSLAAQNLNRMSESIGSPIEFVLLPDFVPQTNNRTSQYSVFRNIVYEYAIKKHPLKTIDYLVIADVDMIHPITMDQWISSFTFQNDWEVMTANGLWDRTHTYYDIFAYRAFDQPYKRNIADIYPEFQKHYGFSLKCVPVIPMFNSFTRVKAAHGGLAIYQGDAWRRAVGEESVKPFEESLSYDVCEHIPLQEKFSKIYINPHLLFYHPFRYPLPFDKYKILVPRNGGFFSSFNFLMAALALPTRIYPLWNKEEMDKRLGHVFKQNSKHFNYLGNESNGFLNFFEPIQYSMNDKTMISESFQIIDEKDIFSYDINFLEEFIFPARKPFWSQSFPVFRQYFHGIYSRFIRPKQRFLDQVNKLLPKDKNVYKIGVHLRNPIHFVESGAIFYRQYFEVIDRVLETHPDAIIFVASDTQFPLYELIHRYGTSKVKYHRGFARTSLDLFLETFYPLGAGHARLDLVGQVKHLNSSKVISPELHTQQRPANASSLGDEVLIDVLSLSACDEYIGISSNIALACSYINPNMKMHTIQGLDDPKTYDLIKVDF